MELCDEVDDVGDSTSSSADGNISSGNNHLPGASPISIVLKTHKDRPAGTSWILPGGSQIIDAATAKEEDGQDFFDQFEQQTGGENFNRGEESGTSAGAAITSSDKQDVGAANNKVKDEEEDEDDDMNDFFDEFENVTGGENFKR